MPTYKITFKKRGLTEQELRDPVEEKLQQLCRDIPGTVHGLEGSVNDVIKDICLAETKKTRDLDGRGRSGEKYEEEKILPDSKTAPMKWLKSQRGDKGKQGEQRPDKQVIKSYHRVQHELLVKEWLTYEKFRDIFCVEGGEIYSVEISVSSLYFIPDDPHFLWRRLPPAEFCNVRDKTTIRYLKDFDKNHDKRMSRKEEVDEVYRLCKKVAMGRFAGDMMVDNDPMNLKAYDQWRDHVSVIIPLLLSV